MIKEFKHGHSGYTHHKCKCSVCQTAHAEYCSNHYLNHRTERLERQRIYKSSVTGKMVEKKYNSSPKGKTTAKEYKLNNQGKIRVQRIKWLDKNKGKLSAQYKQWRAKKIATDPNFDKKKSIKYLYGIDLCTYNLMLDSQDGHCACCATKPGAENMGRGLAVDHDHVTGKVRGLLCGKCNSMLGYAKDDRVLLLTAIDYLEKHRN